MGAETVTLPTLRARKAAGEKITMVTCYDASFARLLDEAGIDVLLVGDSLGMVIQGYKTTLPVTMEDARYHTRAVVRGTRRAHVVADMPFLSYQVSLEEAVRNAGTLIQAGAAAVKLEGGAVHVELVARLSSIGIPVMGHLGLTPQSFHQLGGFKVQGRGDAAAEALLRDAKALEAAGAYSLVLEGIPLELAAQITKALTIPTIGIGAGPHCDGQVLVIYDLLGLDDRFSPRFVRKYEDFAAKTRAAVGAFARDVRSGAFPSKEESFSSAASADAPVATPYGGGADPDA